jgi:hypothetical protein
MTEIRLSTHKNKKYDVLYKGKWIPFGDNRYEHYKTSELIPKSMHIYNEHKNPERRRSYRMRAKGILNKNGELTYKDKNSPNYWAYHLLW